MLSIPTYALYGESETDSRHWLHWETITSRSRLHGFRIDAHRHDQLHQIVYLCAGSAELMLDGENISLAPPSLVLLPPLAVHGFAFSSDVDGFVLTVVAAEFNEAVAALRLDGTGLTGAGALRPAEGLADAPALDRAVRDLVEEAGRPLPGQDGALRARYGLLLVLAHRMDLAAARIARAEPGPAEAHARRFLRLVDLHYRDTRKVGFYAGRLGITATHLNRICRQVCGSSALGVIERRILLEARRYLQFSTLSVKEIAILLGYEDPAYFSRLFRRRTGRGAVSMRRELRLPPPLD
ncbi:helix-turn-helix domain-containing protein [Aureimonas populi]|uniref:Helix-turn-helix domain-containing protein n=1 Tax=Aureimonas populi TaxID=1701758 RepID=A0ABW5CJU0_9HYPH|nr:helix-turn-helix domain-containing protein [Aureimonas populi]